MKYIISESQVEKISRRLQEEESREKKIKKIQQFLVDDGYYLGDYGENEDGVDGKYGELTKKAVEEFQRKYGNLKIDGKVGTETAKAMGNNIEPVFKKKEETDSSKNKTSEKSQTKSKEEDKSKSTTDGEYYIITPDGYTGKEAHLFVGGDHSHQGGKVIKSYLKKFGDMVAEYVKNKIVISTHQFMTFDKAQKYAKEKYGVDITSIAGFSAGGHEAWRHASSSNFKIVGLIDPSTTKTDLNIGSNTYLLANPSNWGDIYSGIRSKLKWYCDNKDEAKYKGHVFCPKISHVGMVGEFYSKYSSKI